MFYKNKFFVICITHFTIHVGSKKKLYCDIYHYCDKILWDKIQILPPTRTNTRIFLWKLNYISHLGKVTFVAYLNQQNLQQTWFSTSHKTKCLSLHKNTWCSKCTDNASDSRTSSGPSGHPYCWSLGRLYLLYLRGFHSSLCYTVCKDICGKGSEGGREEQDKVKPLFGFLKQHIIALC